MTNSTQLLDAESLKRWTTLIPGRNLLHVVSDYALIFLLHGLAVSFFVRGQEVGYPAWSFILVAMATIVLTGCLIHRIALIGHEASHYLLVKNRKVNDMMADILCFFPLWSSLVSYRQKHLGHHLYPNEAGKDPNLANGKGEKLFGSFPMKRPSCIYRYYALFFWPPFVLRNLLDLVQMLAMGNVAKRTSEQKPRRKRPSALLLGILYLVGFRVLLAMMERTESSLAVVLVPLAFHLVLGIGGVWLLPRAYFKNWEAKLNYDFKLAAGIRLTFYSVVLLIVSWGRHFFDFHYGFYYAMFWIVPLIYVFPYLMILREVYQHANLGTGKLDNSRIIHADPFTRWALLSYGNDFHLIHHIYPNIPHYHLRGAHEALLEQSEAYRSRLEETYGTVHAPEGEVSLAAALSVKAPHHGQGEAAA